MSRHQDLLRGSAVVVSLASLIVLALSCSGDETGPAGGPVAGALDTHCGSNAQEVDLSTCHAAVDAGAPDYGDTRFNSEADDDDCKYHVKFSATPIRQNTNVTFTVTAATKFDGQPAPGANVDAEVFLNDTHPAPNSGQATTEKAGGVYDVGPIRFDATGRWTVRFHLHEDCQDATEDSPHGHVAFFVDVP
jgi:hypothetical protein